MKSKLVIILGAVLLFSACQQRKRAALHTLYLSNIDLETQIHSLSKRQHGFLTDSDRVILTSLDRKAKRAELKPWQHIVIETDLKLRAIEKLKTKCLKALGVNRYNASFPATFVNKAHKTFDARPLQSNIAQIKAYADSLYHTYPQLIKVSPNQGLLQTNQMPWTLFYTEINQWKMALLKATQKIIEHHTRHLHRKSYKYNSLRFFLEVLAEKNTVLEGEEYRAHMMIAEVYNKARPRMRVNGNEIAVLEGQGMVRLRPKKTGLHEWTGAITFKDKGRDTTFTIKKKYWVLPK